MSTKAIEWGRRAATRVAGDPLTAKQRAILEFVRAKYLERGVPPSLREVRDFTGLSSTSAVMVHFEPLMRKGFLRQVGAGVSRGYLPVTSPGSCPCCGRPQLEGGGEP